MLSMDTAPPAMARVRAPRLWVDLTVLAEPPRPDIAVEVIGPRGDRVWSCAQIERSETLCGEASGWWRGPGVYRVRASHSVRRAPEAALETAHALVELSGDETWVAIVLEYDVRARALTRTAFEVQVREPTPSTLRLAIHPPGASTSDRDARVLVVNESHVTFEMWEPAARALYWHSGAVHPRPAAPAVVEPNSSAPAIRLGPNSECWQGGTIEVIVQSGRSPERAGEPEVMRNHLLTLECDPPPPHIIEQEPLVPDPDTQAWNTTPGE
jgi:hypothetical protein